MEDLQRFTVEIKFENETERISKLLAVFPNGRPKPRTHKEIHFSCYQKSTQTNFSARERLLVAKTHRLHYTAYSTDPWLTQGSKINCCRYFIGIRNKKTNILHLHSACIFICQPLLEYKSQFDSSSNATLSYTEQLKSLTSAFGSKRKRQSAEAQKKYHVEEKYVSSFMQDAVNDYALKPKETSHVKKEIQDAAIPPKNVNAISAENVYSISDIIPEQEYSALNIIAKTLCTASKEEIAEWEHNGMYCSYVIRHLKHSHGVLSTHKSTLLCYFNFLATLIGLGYRDIRRKDPLPKIAEPFKSNLLLRFITTTETDTQTLSRSMPPRMKDKAIAFAMVLALFIDNFSLNMSHLKDLKAQTTKLTMIAQALGCRVTSKFSDGLQSKVIELKLPLFVPRAFVKQKSRK